MREKNSFQIEARRFPWKNGVFFSNLHRMNFRASSIISSLNRTNFLNRRFLSSTIFKMSTTLVYGKCIGPLSSLPIPSRIIVGEKATLTKKSAHLSGSLSASSLPSTWLSPISDGTVEILSHHYLNSSSSKASLTVATISSERSRTNACIRADQITEVIGKALLKNLDTHITGILIF